MDETPSGSQASLAVRARKQATTDWFELSEALDAHGLDVFTVSVLSQADPVRVTIEFNGEAADVAVVADQTGWIIEGFERPSRHSSLRPARVVAGYLAASVALGVGAWLATGPVRVVLMIGAGVTAVAGLWIAFVLGGITILVRSARRHSGA